MKRDLSKCPSAVQEPQTLKGMNEPQDRSNSGFGQGIQETWSQVPATSSKETKLELQAPDPNPGVLHVRSSHLPQYIKQRDMVKGRGKRFIM
jgi:hypothetical protein